MIPIQLSLMDRRWCDQSAELVIARMRGKQFISDDLRGILAEPDNRNLFGVLMAKLRCGGFIRPVGWQVSKRPEANGRAVRVWEVVC